MPSASGVQTFELDIPLNTAGGECYIYAFIGHIIDGWYNHVADEQTADGVISVIPFF
ncbi:MAG: hypothetical protein GY841_22935 [FCB group bacterium]|nr:hypothetical protein [FCB group bacterium]